MKDVYKRQEQSVVQAFHFHQGRVAAVVFEIDQIVGQMAGTGQRFAERNVVAEEERLRLNGSGVTVGLLRNFRFAELLHDLF